MQVSTKLFNQQQVNQFKQLNEEIQSIQNKISSGKNILQASDDPVGAVELSGLSQVKGKISQYIENIDIVIVEGFKNEGHKKIEVIRNYKKKSIYMLPFHKKNLLDISKN